EDGIRDFHVTGVQTCALPISMSPPLIAKPSYSDPIWRIAPIGRTRAQVNDPPIRSASAQFVEVVVPVGDAVAAAQFDRLVPVGRSEERRVGKEGRARGWAGRS